MSLYGGHKYNGFWPILAALAVAHAVSFMAKFYGNNMLFAVGEPQMSLAADGIPGVFNVFLSALLIRTLGRWGIAWSQLLTYALAFLVSRHLLSKLIRTKIVIKDWLVLMKAFLPAAAVVVLAQTFTARLPILAAWMLAGAVLFAVLLMLSISDSDRAALESVLPGSIRFGVNRIRELWSTV
jgi:O-antigen/teichoic acid export membrane protein